MVQSNFNGHGLLPTKTKWPFFTVFRESGDGEKTAMSYATKHGVRLT